MEDRIEADDGGGAAVREAPPAETIEAVNGRFTGFPLFEAAAASLAADLAAADTRVVYMVTRRYAQVLGEAAGLIAALHRPPSPRRNVILVCDLSNEGVVFAPRFVLTLRELKAAWPGRIGVILVQTSASFDETARRHRLPVPVAFPRYHHHETMFLRTCLAEDVAAQGLALLDRKGPLRAFLCLNNTPRLHRLLVIRFLARRMKGDHVATFAGFDRSKLDWRQVLEANQRHFPSVVDLDALVAEVQALGVGGLTDPSLPLHRMAHAVEPEFYRQTFASLVTETEMTPGAIRRYTEKTLKPLAMGHPVIVAGNPQTLPLLEELGFDFLRDAVDQEYDAAQRPERRLERMKRSALKLAGLDQEERMAFLRRHRDRLARNIEQFDGRLLAAQEARYTRQMAEAIGGMLPHLTA